MAKKGSVLLNLLNFGPAKVNDVLSVIGDIDCIFKVSASDLRQISSLRKKDVEAILSFRDSKVLDKELKFIEKEKIDCIDIFDENYPSLLKEIDSFPLVLYIKGDLKLLGKFSLAVVGSRVPTAYGVSVAKDFSSKLSELGLVIVSGLAKGIDTVAHEQAVEKGRTVAVLGSGLLNVYPKENKKLAEAISRKGALISEFPLLTGPASINFPRRNRIVSGLSKGVLVVEAALRSGARITARLAAEQNREVFAVPGSINSPLSRGTHLLIKEGAKLVEGVEDILEELNIKAETCPESEQVLDLKDKKPLRNSEVL